MTIETTTLTISVTTLIGVVSALFHLFSKFGALELKVNTMWEFQVRRAFSEAVSTGVAKANSPLTFEPEVLAKLDPIKLALTLWWKREGQHLRGLDTLLAIERCFGEELLQRLCIPYKMHQGACTLAALSVARGTRMIDSSTMFGTDK